MKLAKKALVTGGAGFIGAHLVRLLAQEGWVVDVIDDESAGMRENLKTLQVNHRFFKVNLAESGAMEQLNLGQIDALFHLAGNANVPRSVREPLYDFSANVHATLNVLEYARQHQVGRIIFPSSASVYHPGAVMPIREDARTRASSPYGAAKIACENYCLAFSECYGLVTTVVRFFNVYGPLMNRFAIYDIVRKLQRDPDNLTILGDGGQIRDFLYVEDAARALLVAAESGETGEVYNAATGVPVRIKEVAESIVTLMGLSHVKFTFTGESWPGDVKEWYGDTSKIRDIGFFPKVSWHDGLNRTVSYIVGNTCQEQAVSKADR